MVITKVGPSSIQGLGPIGKADHEITEKSLSFKRRNRVPRWAGGVSGAPLQGLQALSVGRMAGGLPGHERGRNINNL